MNRPLKRSGIRRALARAGFRRLFAAETISRWGDTFSSVALVILVYWAGGALLLAAGGVGLLAGRASSPLR